MKSGGDEEGMSKVDEGNIKRWKLGFQRGHSEEKGTSANESGCLKGSTRMGVKPTIEIKNGGGAVGFMTCCYLPNYEVQ